MNESTHSIETPATPETAATTDTAGSAETAAGGIADGVRRSLNPKVIPLQRTIGGIVTACVSLPLGIAVGLLWAAAGPPPGVVAGLVSVWAVVTGGLGWWLYRWPVLHHRHASYAVHPDGIEIRKGVIWRQAISVARSRVQHTDVSQGPLERKYGLGTLGIYTAGTDHAKVSLDGLEHETALRIRDHLLPPAGDDAV
ncbi:PH domain-containing protein [Candidatus Palauibacter polyketidifaciens]|uniref:PH domain-containing protein n=1 Tax=Candidatus Palauibacter polyketidifaciens TaxID=3056740 RepID=UPI00239239B9|nr:PH domain-containing protein [Candidatus Palauibacter polyketidifaciens]MDE2719388.1 PH domain-containing protein [Candidatus Palauibacter polyketidifaciens]